MMARVDTGVRVVGFDCAEEAHEWVLLDGDGGVDKGRSVTNGREAIENALGALITDLPKGTQLVVVVESTRSHGRLVADAARRLGCDVWQVNTVALNHFRDVEGQPRKDDPWDAYLAARMVFLRLKGCREVAEALPEERALCRLTRAYSRMTDRRTAILCQLRAILLELVPEVLHRSWQGPKYGSKAMFYILKRWPGFSGLERAHQRSIEKILLHCKYCQEASKVANSLRQLAKQISMDPAEREVVAMETRILIQQLELINTSIADAAREIKQRVEAHPVGLKLLEMPGIGFITAGVLIGELLPIARHTSEGKAATYSGVTPLSRKTGKSKDRPLLARGTNHQVLNALYMSSVSAVKCSAIDKAYYHKKLDDYSGHPAKNKAAFIALSRQRHKVVFKLMTTDARYDKETLIARHLDRIHQAEAA
jgi:transposase